MTACCIMVPRRNQRNGTVADVEDWTSKKETCRETETKRGKGGKGKEGGREVDGDGKGERERQGKRY